MKYIFIPVILLLAGAADLPAQDRAVQQPVVRQFRVGTTVSVPDRGRAFLGGVSSGAMGTKRFGGPLRSGTNSGSEFFQTSQSVSVYIHDFDAMDAALLNAAAESSRQTRSNAQLNPRAANAWQSLQARHAARTR